ncbi:MAG TPA: adenine deaminase [Bacillota bacterium]|nr:adenine deaminase [Bacillota bacterium]
MVAASFQISGNILDPIQKRIFPGVITVTDGIITDISPVDAQFSHYITPGLIDAHLHIESTMLIPSEFARIAVTHGTVAVLADPHEIANVLGIDGIIYMIENAKTTPLKTYFGVPSCVPATPYETAGAVLNNDEIERLFKDYHLAFMGEMMNYPGVISGDPEVLARLALARKYGKPIDGHAPGLTGPDLMQYIQAGISTDHEAYALDEALAKIEAGMKIIIREGSAAKNFGDLHPLISQHPAHVMLCSDDKHPDLLIKGHLTPVVKQALQLGYTPFDLFQCTSVNPVHHYRLEVGLLQIGDPADFLIIDNFENFTVLATYIQGTKVAENGRCLFPATKAEPINNFRIQFKKATDFQVHSKSNHIHVIEAIPDQLITRHRVMKATKNGDLIVSDVSRDLLKIAVVNRYREQPPAIGFIQNFGLREGAIASSVAHDSHNIVVIGVDDSSIAEAVNLIIASRGGLALVSEQHREVLSLPVAGLMSTEDGYTVAAHYEKLAAIAKELGCPHKDAFMTMSFMALLVIPELKMSDRGLFDSTRFQLIPLEAE